MFDPHRHHRQSIRLKGWDYSGAGYYFVTICTHGRENIFGEMVDGVMVLSALGEIVREEWLKTAVLREYVVLGTFIIMPNHLHGILVFHNPTQFPAVGATRWVAQEREGTLQKGSLGSVLGQFKSAVTKRYDKVNETSGVKVWQRGYYERIVRNERELNAIQWYVENNPVRWAEDRENLDALLARMVRR